MSRSAAQDPAFPDAARSRDGTYDEDLATALALSLSEVQANEEERTTRPNINPDSPSAVAVAKEEERLVQEAIQLSIAESSKPSAVLDCVPLPAPARLDARGIGQSSMFQLRGRGVSPFLQTDIDPSDLPELV